MLVVEIVRIEIVVFLNEVVRIIFDFGGGEIVLVVEFVGK